MQPTPGCEFQGAGGMVAPAAQIDRTARFMDDLHAQHIAKEPQAFLPDRRQQLDVAEMGDVVKHAIRMMGTSRSGP
jgi:hypothetical protein